MDHENIKKYLRPASVTGSGLFLWSFISLLNLAFFAKNSKLTVNPFEDAVGEFADSIFESSILFNLVSKVKPRKMNNENFFVIFILIKYLRMINVYCDQEFKKIDDFARKEFLRDRRAN